MILLPHFFQKNQPEIKDQNITVQHYASKLRIFWTRYSEGEQGRGLECDAGIVSAVSQILWRGPKSDYLSPYHPPTPSPHLTTLPTVSGPDFARHLDCTAV
jgi:hypothetical protein